jgi:hypothetical protein
MNIMLLAVFGLACFLIWAHGYWMGWRDRDARRPVSTLLLTDELRNLAGLRRRRGPVQRGLCRVADE